MGKWVFFGIFFLVGSFLVFAGWSMLQDARRRASQWIRTTGVVTGYQERPRPSGPALYAPVYRFTAGAAEMTGTGSVAARPPAYRVGDQVALLVNPANLAESEIVDRNTWLFSWGFLLAGGLTLLLSALIAWAIVSGRLA